MKEWKKNNKDYKFDELCGKILDMLEQGLKTDEIKLKLSEIGDNPSPELFSRCMLEAKRLIAKWEFKDLEEQVWGIIEDADEELGIHIDKIKAILCGRGYDLSPEYFSKLMHEVKKAVCYDKNELFFWDDKSYENKAN